MANALFNELNGGANNSFLARLKQFKQTMSGNPQQIIQNMINSGRISQTQVNQYAQQANELYKQFKDLI